MKKIESIKEFGGYLERYTHHSQVCQCEMTFSVYLPSQVQQGNVPSLYWLSGLTCSDDNFRVKAGAQRYASEQGIALIIPDTSPRGEGVSDYSERYDLGIGAGFYVDATQKPWDRHYNMYSYVVQELPQLIEKEFPVIPGVKSISGHSMGGHGALICALRNPTLYVSVSAFAPICHPMDVPWGTESFRTYLGDNQEDWRIYDAVSLIRNQHKIKTLLVDQGTEDEFLSQQLRTDILEEVCKENNINLDLRMQEGYDHSYHFIGSFIGEHIAYHANYLKNNE